MSWTLHSSSQRAESVAGVAALNRTLYAGPQTGIARARAEGKTLGRPPALAKVRQAEAIQRLVAGEFVAKVARDYGTTRQSIMRVRERLSQSIAADS